MLLLGPCERSIQSVFSQTVRHSSFLLIQFWVPCLGLSQAWRCLLEVPAIAFETSLGYIICSRPA